MKFSEQWLRSWVNPQVSREELVARLSMVGLEVDAVTPVAGSFSGVVVGEVLETAQHPDADKLRVCQVSNGSETLQVVCGAPNVRPGLKIPFAMIGAQLPGDFKIKKAKLRGIESNGMLCSETELQVGSDDSGLMELANDAPVGTDFREFLGLDDVSIEIGLTPNRGDCLSIAGLAREVGAIYGVVRWMLQRCQLVMTTRVQSRFLRLLHVRVTSGVSFETSICHVRRLCGWSSACAVQTSAALMRSSM